MRPKSARAAGAPGSACLKNPAIVRLALVRVASPYFNLQGSVLAVTGLVWNRIVSTLLARHVQVAAGRSIGDGNLSVYGPKKKLRTIVGIFIFSASIFIPLSHRLRNRRQIFLPSES